MGARAGLPVTVYNGQLDLICCTLGVHQWLTRLDWAGLKEFQNAKPTAVHVDDDDDDDDYDRVGSKDASALRHPDRRATRLLDVDTVGFLKAHANLALFTIMDAGHMVPADQPEAGLYLLSQVPSCRTLCVSLCIQLTVGRPPPRPAYTNTHIRTHACTRSALPYCRASSVLLT